MNAKKSPYAPYLLSGFYSEKTLPMTMVRNLLLSSALWMRKPFAVVVVPVLGQQFNETFDCLEDFEDALSTLPQDSSIRISLKSLNWQGKLRPMLMWNHHSYLPPAKYSVVNVASDGHMFTTGGEYPERAGVLEYSRFVSSCSVIVPTYAAITVDWDLENPGQLIDDPTSDAFADFFLGNALGQSLLMQVVSMFEGAYIETLPSGVYISSTEYFNPRGVGFDTNRKLKLSATVGRMLADHFRKEYEH